MFGIESTLLETLVHMSEGSTLDFKERQYSIVGATDEQKAEFVKDVVAFANAWKTSDAYIVIGVIENPGGRATVVGIDEHHDDADLQQLVNSKTSVPVDFQYVPSTLDGKRIGVVRIARTQQRPVFLRRRFGRLEANVVFVRRSSSTDVAAPDEVARMGIASVDSASQPSVEIALGDPRSHTLLGPSTTMHSCLLSDPTLAETSVSDLEIYAMYTIGRPTRAQAVAHTKELALLQQFCFVAQNTGTVLLRDLRIVVDIAKSPGLRVLDAEPQLPLSPLEAAGVELASNTVVSERTEHFRLESRIRKLQPSATAWSDAFWIGSGTPCAVELPARVYADNLARPIDVRLHVDISFDSRDFAEWEAEQE